MHAILVVDDDAASCNALAKLLTHVGDRAVCVTSGAMALSYLRTHVPRLVILDVMMPEMDGLAVLGEIRSDLRLANVPVIMYSALSDEATMERARSSGANDYWIKTSIDYSRLKELVGPYLAESA